MEWLGVVVWEGDETEERLGNQGCWATLRGMSRDEGLV